MPLNIEKLRKLSPTERIKRLRKIEEDRKKEIEEAEAMIKQSEEELRQEKIPDEVRIPEPEHVDISQLFIPAGSQLEVHAAEARKEEQEIPLLYHTGEVSIDRVDYQLNIPTEDFVKMEERLDIRRYSSISSETAKMATASLQILDHIKKYSSG